MGKTSIEWTRYQRADGSWAPGFTFNPWIGCTKVGPACDHCYAEDMMANRYRRVEWGAGEDRIRTSAANWREPLRWDRIAQADGTRPTVFCLSLGDIWDNEVDPLWRRQLFDLIERTPHLIWLLLSKRIGNAIKMCDPMAGNTCLPKNAALGATMVTQPEWDKDAQKLEEARDRLGALFSFASVEPMLGPIDARKYMPNWVICGGESGKHARPMHHQWARDIRDQCAAAGVPFFLKQWGEWLPGESNGEGRFDAGKLLHAYRRCDNHSYEWPQTSRVDNFGTHADRWSGHLTARRVGKRAAGRLLDGVQHDGMPVLTR
jgi:protein gp37